MSAQLERLVQQLLNRVRQLEDDRSPPQVESWTEVDAFSFFLLAEDISAADQEEVYVWLGELDGASIVRQDGQTSPLKMVNVNFCLSPDSGFARAGYSGAMQEINGRWAIIATYECINACTVPEGYDIPQPEFDAGTVDAAYTFTIAVDGTIDDVNADPLPDGLEFDPETLEISGTPTTAGEYWITVTGTAGGCTITRLAILTIAEAVEE